MSTIVVLGSLLLIIGAGILVLAVVGVVNRTNWYHFRPTAWVISDLDRPSPVAERAWGELQLRLFAGEVSAEQQDRLTERALREQTAPRSLSLTDSLMNYLGQRYDDHALTAAQQQRLFAGCEQLVVTARPQVGSGDVIPYRLSTVGRGPDDWRAELQTVSLRVDNHDAVGEGIGTGGFPLGGFACVRTIDPQPAGHHYLHVTLRFRVGELNKKGEIASTIHIEDKVFTTDFEVLPVEPALGLVSAPNRSTLRGFLEVRGFQRLASGELIGVIDFRRPPVNLAFDIFARAAGKEYSLGSVTIGAGKQGEFVVGGEGFPRDPSNTVDVILRSSESAARNTVDLTQIWQGEVLFPKVPVKQLAE